MTLRELVETLKGFGGTIALHDGDTLTIEPPEVLTPAVRAALASTTPRSSRSSARSPPRRPRSTPC